MNDEIAIVSFNGGSPVERLYLGDLSATTFPPTGRIYDPSSPNKRCSHRPTGRDSDLRGRPSPTPIPSFWKSASIKAAAGVYPYPVIDPISDAKVDHEYDAVFLENRYLKIMILPELGGRVAVALDKTNGYHFVYYNRVIKPALVGLAGPWISGGIEFNWPQHHRPSTF